MFFASLCGAEWKTARIVLSCCSDTNWRLQDFKKWDQMRLPHKLNMSAVFTKQTNDIIASAVAAQFPTNRG